MGREDSNNDEVAELETDQYEVKSGDDDVMSEEDAQGDVENASDRSHDSDDAENQSTVSNSDREEDLVMGEPLECHQFDWSTEAVLLEGLMSLPLDNNYVKKILNGKLSDIVDALIEYYMLSELKAQLIILHKQAGPMKTSDANPKLSL